MADPQPVKLRDLTHSLASIMVATTRYLDQSAANLQQLYSGSIDSDLSGFTAPRFTIDEVTVDLSFLVDEVVTEPESPPQPTPAATISATQRRALSTALGQLQLTDEAAFAEWERQVADFRDAVAKWEQQVQASAFDRQLRDLAQEEHRLRRAASGSPFGVRFPQLQERLAEIAARRAEVVAQQSQLQAERPIEPAAPPGINGQDYGVLWTQFEGEYAEARHWYESAVDAYEKERSVPNAPQRVGTAAIETAVGRLIDRAEADADVLDAARGMIADRATVAANTDRLFLIIADAQGAGIRVRIDPTSIAAADEDALQHLQLTFRAEGQETVDVAGDTVEIPR